MTTRTMNFHPRKGHWDMFASGSSIYIVRTDMPENDPEKPDTWILEMDNNWKAKRIFKAAPDLVGGDAYLGYRGYMGLIKGGKYLRTAVSNAGDDSLGKVEDRTFHKDWYGMDHYMVTTNHIWGIRGDNYYYSAASDGFTQTPTSNTLNQLSKGALCYYGSDHHLYYLKEDSEGLVNLYQISSFTDSKEIWKKHIPSKILTFIPGGLTQVYGSPQSGEEDTRFHRYEKIGGFENNASSPVEHGFKLTYNTGQMNEIASSVEDNWNVSATVSASYQISIFAMVARAELSVTAGGGGATTQSEKSAWHRSKSVIKEFKSTVQGHKGVYYWRGVAGIGQTTFIGGDSIIRTETAQAPEFDDNAQKTYFTDTKTVGEVQEPDATPKT